MRVRVRTPSPSPAIPSPTLLTPSSTTASTMSPTNHKDDSLPSFSMTYAQFCALHAALTSRALRASARLRDGHAGLASREQLILFLLAASNAPEFDPTGGAMFGASREDDTKTAVERVSAAIVALGEEIDKEKEKQTQDGIVVETTRARASAVPTLMDDARFRHFGDVLDRVVGAALVVDIGDNDNDGDNAKKIGTPSYAGPQRCILLFNVHGAITAVYAPGYDNTRATLGGHDDGSGGDGTREKAADRHVLAIAGANGLFTRGSPPPFSTPENKTETITTTNAEVDGSDVKTAATSGLYLAQGSSSSTGGLPLLTPFADAEYPPPPTSSSSMASKTPHALFNLRHAQLFEELGTKPWRKLQNEFPVLKDKRKDNDADEHDGKNGMTVRVSGGLLRALAVLQSILKGKLSEEEVGEGSEGWDDDSVDEDAKEVVLGHDKDEEKEEEDVVQDIMVEDERVDEAMDVGL